MLDIIIYYILIIFGGFILGFLLGMIRFKDVYLGPNSKKVYEQTFEKDGYCYKLIPEEIKCGIFDKHI
jgi:hypothetical protein